MAGGKFYAWTNFDTERNEWGQTVNSVHVGDEVTQVQINATDDQWAELLATGAVREMEYPDIPKDVSPAEYFRQKLNDPEATEEEIEAAQAAFAETGTADTESKKAAAAAEGEEESSSSSSSSTTPKTQTASTSKS